MQVLGIKLGLSEFSSHAAPEFVSWLSVSFIDAHICRYSCTSLPIFLLVAQKFLTLRNLHWFFPCICFCYCVSLDITHTLQNIYLHFWKICILGRNFIKFIHHFGHYCHFNEGFQSMNIGFIEILLVLTMVCYFQDISPKFLWFKLF